MHIFFLGAYYGMEKVPENLKRHCEAITEAIEQGDKLYNLVDTEAAS